jgi:hypothetical protein
MGNLGSSETRVVQALKATLCTCKNNLEVKRSSKLESVTVPLHSEQKWKKNNGKLYVKAILKSILHMEQNKVKT